ncbi:hypothetical protein SAMN05192548_1005124 [Paraburkholderia terricola]|uniref:Uncharacterized protein n=1 Tax=Paraburkholderia terricola TaxID=169427 RepID=A0A1M6LHT9_9BURK|nr:hypothetical protein SAMN05192547_1005123 [Paraburkholderia sediminicola]SHJ70727.1 hypothetical protein SAMN05192548_1005124 [Paraburkholderia terricola]
MTSPRKAYFFSIAGNEAAIDGKLRVVFDGSLGGSVISDGRLNLEDQHRRAIRRLKSLKNF